jgi:hypothetical protein
MGQGSDDVFDELLTSVATRASRRAVGPGAKAKLKAYLLAHVGEVLDSEALRAVAKTSEWARRIRELRDEEGMNIITHNDDSNLSPGQYKLVDTKPLPAFERGISKQLRALVLDRNGFTCQMCGAVAGEAHPYDRGKRTRLHIGHIVDKSMGGTDDPQNLRAICSICNEGAANITMERPTAMKLLAQIRRAPGSDQVLCLEWLIKKFPRQAAAILKAKDK